MPYHWGGGIKCPAKIIASTSVIGKFTGIPVYFCSLQ